MSKREKTNAFSALFTLQYFLFIYFKRDTSLLGLQSVGGGLNAVFSNRFKREFLNKSFFSGYFSPGSEEALAFWQFPYTVNALLPAAPGYQTYTCQWLLPGSLFFFFSFLFFFTFLRIQFLYIYIYIYFNQLYHSITFFIFHPALKGFKRCLLQRVFSESCLLFLVFPTTKAMSRFRAFLKALSREVHPLLFNNQSF